MLSKKFDGIKKISGKEFEKSRKIILDYIGEKDKKNKKMIKDIDNDKSKKDLFFSFKKKKMLDGVFVGNKKNMDIENKEVVSEKKLGMDLDDKEKEVFLLENFNNKKQFENEQAEDDENFNRKSNYGRIMEEIQEIKTKYKAENIKQKSRAEEKKAKDESKQGKDFKVIRKKENKKLEKQERQDKKLKMKKEKEEKKMRSIDKRKQIKKKIIKIIKNDIFCKKRIKAMLKLFIYIVIFFVLLVILSYIVFAVLLLRFGLDNNISRRITEYIPVPAVITKIGFINYYDYLAMADTVNKTKLAEEIILNKLAKKYNIDSAVREEIDIQLIKDKDINKITFSRINKIFQLVKNGEDFDKIGEKYSDKFGNLNEHDDYLLFDDKIKDLEKGKISNIIITNKGYYIIKKNNSDMISYIFIKPIILDEYLKDNVNNAQVWVLAD